jgi:hypothetical protein
VVTIMLAQPNLLTTMVTGALDQEFIYSASKGSGGGYIQSVRRYTTPFQPNTPAQIAVRNAFKMSSKLFKDSLDKTIGAAVFLRADFLAAIDTIGSNLNYRGVPSQGTSANRQIWIMAAILQSKAVADYDLWNVLPQDIVLEADLQALLDNIDAALTLIATRTQRDRIGYVS